MCILRKTIHQNTQPPNILQRPLQTRSKTRKKPNIQTTKLLQTQKPTKPNPNRHTDNRTTQTPRQRKRSRNRKQRSKPHGITIKSKCLHYIMKAMVKCTTVNTQGHHVQNAKHMNTPYTTPSMMKHGVLNAD